MTTVAHGTQIYLATGATDMRRGLSGLQGQIISLLKQNPLSGHLFLFFNRRRDRLKILYWDQEETSLKRNCSRLGAQKQAASIVKSTLATTE